MKTFNEFKQENLQEKAGIVILAALASNSASSFIKRAFKKYSANADIKKELVKMDKMMDVNEINIPDIKVIKSGSQKVMKYIKGKLKTFLNFANENGLSNSQIAEFTAYAIILMVLGIIAPKEAKKVFTLKPNVFYQKNEVHDAANEILKALNTALTSRT